MDAPCHTLHRASLPLRNRGIHLAGRPIHCYDTDVSARGCVTVVSEKVAFGVVLAAGVVLPGLANYFLTSAGYETLGSLAWALGFGTMVFVVWYVWLRPTEITGPVQSE